MRGVVRKVVRGVVRGVWNCKTYGYPDCRAQTAGRRLQGADCRAQTQMISEY